ncbi:MAG: hypothetical protein HC919_02175 [Oscillatoriales cyanobacterium SM2_2_1]|nr:hypothetical protein [Oscillatoriales cyanobacterium SM2_2_1]
MAGGATLALQYPRLTLRLTGQTLEGDRQAVSQEAARLNLIEQLPPRGLGYNNMLANYAFLQFLQYFGDDVARVQHRTGYGLSARYFDVVITRDPRFDYSYIYLSTSVSMYAAEPSRAIALYGQGLKSLDPTKQPYAYTVWRRKAVDQLLFLGDAAGARQSYLMAADWADRATFGRNALPETEFVPGTQERFVSRLSRQSAEWLRDGRDLRQAQIAAWTLVVTSVVDQQSLKRAIAELDRLGMLVDLDEQGQIRVRPKISSQTS